MIDESEIEMSKWYPWSKHKFFCCYLILLAFLPSAATAYAKEPDMGRLIQSTTFEEDYQALVHLGLTGTPLLEEEDQAAAFANVLGSCVRIQGGGHYGSGNIYALTEDEIIIVTNRHVLDYFDGEGFVTFFNGRTADGRILGLGEEADVGFISVPAGLFPFEELLSLKSVRMRDGGCETLNASGSFFIVDAASSPDSPVLCEGRILDERRYLADYGREMLYGGCRAVPGMSGSGIFDFYGNYIGILSGGTLQGEIAGVPADEIGRIYREVLENP